MKAKTTLSRLERKTLSNYVRYRECPPTVSGMARKAILPWFIFVVISLIGTAVVFFVYFVAQYSAKGDDMSDQHVAMAMAMFFGVWMGLVVGTVTRDILHCKLLVRNWPLLLEITNWKVVDEWHFEQAPEKADEGADEAE